MKYPEDFLPEYKAEIKQLGLAYEDVSEMDGMDLLLLKLILELQGQLYAAQEEIRFLKNQLYYMDGVNT